MAKKTSTTKTETVPAAAPAPVDVAPVADKTVKSKKASKTVEASPAPAPAAAAPAPETSADVEVPVAEQSVEFLSKLNQLGALINSLKAEYKTLEKKWTRELKTAQKQSSKRKRKAGNRAPSGFVKPTRISEELAKFLDKPVGTEMARTEVTRDINKYIQTNNLQDKKNGRKINPDSKLAALLKLKGTDELTYFNLQRYMSPHFAKATKEATA